MGALLVSLREMPDAARVETEPTAASKAPEPRTFSASRRVRKAAVFDEICSRFIKSAAPTPPACPEVDYGSRGACGLQQPILQELKYVSESPLRATWEI